jgi:hypothetical protein
MSQGYLLLNNDLGLLCKQVATLDNGRNRFFVHMDSKYQLDTSSPLLHQLQVHPRVKLLDNRINIQWGSIRLVDAVMRLMKEAMQYDDIEYVHLLSTQCFPVKSNDYIDEYLRANKGTQFLNFFPITKNMEHGWGEQRMSIYHFHEWYNPRSKKTKDVLIKNASGVFRKLQKAVLPLGISRAYPKGFPLPLYGGSAWWSISGDCARYLLQYFAEHPAIYKRFAFSQLPDESIFQTVLLNSPFKDKVRNENLRYLKFQPNSSYAAEIDASDIDRCREPQVLFARKFSLNSLYLLSEISI